MKPSSSKSLLIWMILLSLFLGIFISYFFVFVNALFISKLGTSKLPHAYILSAIGGTFITWAFNKFEKKIGFGKSSSIFCLLLAFTMFLLWYLYQLEFMHTEIIFFAYAWFWISINFTTLVFWKLPSNLFNLSENKKYNGLISSGEVISAIFAYLSVPILLSYSFFTRDKLLLISFFGVLGFSIITFFLARGIKVKDSSNKNLAKSIKNQASKTLIQEPYFQLIFLSIFLSVAVQLLIDFSLMEVSSHQMSDPTQLAKYFAFLFGGMRLLEFLLKTFVSKFLIREYGILISLSTLIFALILIAIIGLSSLIIGYSGLILIVASLSKVFERSLFRSIYAPTINVLYQAYPIEKRALTQNFADGFGKTTGQFFAAFFILIILNINEFETKVLVLLSSILITLIIWYIISKNLISHYRKELIKILKEIEIKIRGNENNDSKEIQKNQIDSTKQHQRNNNIFKEIIDSIHSKNEITDLESETSIINKVNNQKAVDLTLQLSNLSGSELNQIKDITSQLIRTNRFNNKFSHLLFLYANDLSILRDEKFSFYHSSKQLKTIDFSFSSAIQIIAKSKSKTINVQEYFNLIEDRIQKYTYLLSSGLDLSSDLFRLKNFIQLEINSSKLDILHCLSLRHDQQVLLQIIQMITEGGKSDELIALELLELVLDDQEKKWILPIFREEDPKRLLKKLEVDFPQLSLSEEKRLLSLIAHKNFDIPLIIVEEALFELILKFPKENYESLAVAFENINLNENKFKVQSNVAQYEKFDQFNGFKTLREWYFLGDQNQIYENGYTNQNYSGSYQLVFPFDIGKLEPIYSR